MSGRIEYKFLVPASVDAALRADILPHLEPDPFSEATSGGEYSVRSIYYDTPRFSCYREKESGIEVRQKFRIRGYGTSTEDSVVFLEIKKRRGCVIAKHRAPLPLSTLPDFLETPDIQRHILGGGASPAKSDASRFLYHYFRLSLQPAVLVVYDREAFFGKFDPSLRVTFDRRLRARLSPRLSDLHDESCLSPVMRRHLIFELKFFHRSLPQWAAQVIRRHSLHRMALSKYTMSMDLAHVRPCIPLAPRVLPAAGYAAV